MSIADAWGRLFDGWAGQVAVCRTACRALLALLALALAHPAVPGQSLAAATGLAPAVFASVERRASFTVSSADGALVVTSDGTRITVWDARRRIELRTLVPGSDGSITGLALDPDGRRLVVGDRRAGLTAWDLATGLVTLRRGGADDPVWNLRRSADGRRLVVMGTRATRVLEWPSLREVAQLGGFLPTEALAVSPDGRHVATGAAGADGIALWDAGTGQRLAIVSAHDGRVEHLHFSPDGRTLLSAGRDNRIAAWDLADPARPQRLHSHAPGRRIQALAISPDGQSYWAAQSFGGLAQWSLREGRALQVAVRNGDLMDLAWLGGGPILMGSGLYGGLRFFDSATGAEQPGIAAAAPRLPGLAVHEPSGRLATPTADQRVAVWGLADSRPLGTLAGHGDRVFGLQFIADGRLFSHGGEGASREWQPGSAASRVLGVSGIRKTITPDGQWLATSDGQGDIRLWDVAKVSAQQRLRKASALPGASSGHVMNLAFVQGGQALVSAHAQPAALVRWKWRDGEAEWAYEWPGSDKSLALAGALAVSADGRMVANGDWDGTLRWWQADSPSLQGTLSMTGLRSPVSALAFSPDGRRLLSGHWSGRLVWWDRETTQPLAELNGHQGEVTAVHVLADGRRAVSASDDGSWRLWDLAQGREVAAHYTDGRGAWLVVLPSGHYMASGAEAERWVLVRHGPGLFDVSDIGAYRERFHRPDLVQTALALKPLPAQLADIATVRPAPGVQLVDTPAVITGDELVLQVRLTDAGGGVGELRVAVNGTVVAQAQGRDLGVAASAVPGELRRIPLKLAPGAHELQVVAFNAEGSMSSQPAVVRVTADYTPVRKPRLHALVVGIEQFANPRLQLRYAVADARAMAALLAQRAAPLFERVEVELRVAPAETGREPLLAALARYRTLDPGDAFVLFVASHGVMVDAEADQREFVLVTSNVGSLSEAALRRDGIRQSELRAAVAGIPAAKKAMFFDTCHSGALGEALAAPVTRGLEEDTAVKLLSSAIGSTVLSASTSAQQAIEGHEGHGIFTWALLQALSGKGDAARKGYVSTLDLAAFVELEVPRIAEQVYRRKQFPLLHTAGQSFPLVSSRP